MTRLAVVVSHPIQYYAPLFRELAQRLDLHVFFGQRVTPAQQAAAGFDAEFDWDVDLTSGFASSFLTNIARHPGPGHFFGCDTPEVGARLAEGRFDGVLVFGWYLKALVQATWAAKRLGLPVLVRGDSQLGAGGAKAMAKAIAYPALLRTFDAALYTGQRSREHFEHYRYPAERLFFSPHAIDARWFAERATAEAGVALRARLGITPGDKVVLFAGKLLPFKRPLDIIEACAGMEAVQVMIAGSGELEPTLRARAADLAVPIHTLGFLNQSEMPAAYAASDILVLPSTGRETWGLVANEALACGKPIVVSDAAGCAPDLAADGAAGCLFRMGDIAALRNNIDRILVDPPSPASITSKSDAYSLTAAAEGIAEAATFCLARA